MQEDLKLLVKNPKLVTSRVEEWFRLYGKGGVCDIIGISRPTLRRRLQLHDWKMKEIKIIYKKLPF